LEKQEKKQGGNIMKLSEAWELYLADRTIERFSVATMQNYKIQINLLIRHFGDVDIEGITLLDLKNYLIEAGSHLKPSSLGQRIRAIRAFFHWASDEGYCERNPASKLKEPREGSHVPKALSEEDTELLREGCQTPLEHALVEFAYTTGCRVGEIYGLNKRDINWENKSAIVTGKGNKQREVYFNIKCNIWLKKYLAKRTDDDPALFATERAPHRMSIAEIRYIIKREAKHSDVESNVYPHILRHSYATHLLNNGAPMEGIQTLMGHAKQETTQVYAQLAGPRRKEIYTKYF